MTINLEMIQALIIYSYKEEHFELVEELLVLFHKFERGEETQVIKKPKLHLVD